MIQQVSFSRTFLTSMVMDNEEKEGNVLVAHMISRIIRTTTTTMRKKLATSQRNDLFLSTRFSRGLTFDGSAGWAYFEAAYVEVAAERR